VIERAADLITWLAGGTSMPWCAWKTFGGKLTSTPNCVVKRDGRLEVFARGADGLVWHLWQQEPMGKWSQWSMMNGTGSSKITVAQNKDGRMQACEGGPIFGELDIALNKDGRAQAFALSQAGELMSSWVVG
jgi:hypothetical protein